ncbi:AraC family transcriptional regulator [Cellulosimicrobium cellulans]|uniref:helix-turn-helix transcriptional regulator n=1 Tax=Cellulosimicrobium cellulans TaxID=1710 RepID=UPI001EDBBFCA|nr:AraC family transcriptional regulator [Cellulosimicrobium cellulans]UKJ64860.1 AraC family transcriptional regulator [Cellulosimicrobium cellulans]
MGSSGDSVRAWHPEVPLVREVLHATFEHHAYPAHTHDAWTVLLIDDGVVTYALDRAPHDAVPASITLLPPHVPHDGRSAVRGRPFRKRVLYLEPDWLPSPAADAAVAAPLLRDPDALTTLADIHAALDHPADAMAAECGVLALRDVVRSHLGTPPSTARDAPLARRLRALLDDRLTESFTVAEAAALLGAHPSHLVRVFSQTYGIAPHRYVTGRRVDGARRLLLEGRPPADAATEVGFHDQAHLTRHFRRVLGTTPGAFAA